MELKNKIRPTILWLGLFVSIMLLQTGTSGVGTIVAFACILLILFCYFRENGLIIRIELVGILTIGWLLISSIVTVLRVGLPGYYVKLVAQIIVFIFMLGEKKVTHKEEAYLKWIFLISMVGYSLLAITERMSDPTRYYHADMVLFGSEIDPNFFGIPIVAAATLMLHEFLLSKGEKTFFAVGYLIMVVAVFCTASRGNFLTLLVGNGLVILNFISEKRIKSSRKFLYIIVLVVAGAFLYGLAMKYFEEAWLRMTSIGQEGSDNGRFDLWGVAIENWKKYPIFGGGMYYNYIANRKATHNTYLQILSETGLVGFTLYLTIWGIMLKRTFKRNKIYFFVLCGTMVQIFFLDALDNRCVWSILCWFAVLPLGNEKKHNNNFDEKRYHYEIS